MDEDFSNVIVRLFLATMLLYHVFDVAEAVLELIIITQKSVTIAVSSSNVLEFFCDYVVVLFVATNVDAWDSTKHNWQADEHDVHEYV